MQRKSSLSLFSFTPSVTNSWEQQTLPSSWLVGCLLTLPPPSRLMYRASWGTKQGHSTFGETSDSGCVVLQARQRLTHPWRRILDGTHLNHTLVKDGWCYRKYAPLDTKLEMLEAVAKAARRGLWADPKPVPPWEGRKIKKLSVNP